MNANNKALAEWAINKIKSEYPDDVALLIAVDNQSTNDDGHSECFDYFIPATERGYELGQTFIVTGVGHDLYPRSWERTERTANFEDFFSNGLGNARIVYCRTKEDEERFLAIRQKMFDNLNDQEFMYKKALVQIENAMNLFRNMMFESELYKVRMAAGYISDYLSTAVAYINADYLKDWKAGTIVQLERMQNTPELFVQYLRGMLLAESADELKNLAHLMISAVRRFAYGHTPHRSEDSVIPDYRGLAEWYQEMALSWRRLSHFCDRNNAEMALGDACYIQRELMIIQEEFALSEMDLLGTYFFTDLTLLKSRSLEIENYIIGAIESHGVQIKKYDTIEDFLKSN